MKKISFCLLVALLAALAPARSATPTPPPVIYHVVTRPLCAELHRHIAPTLAMMLENDRTIKESPKLFNEFNRDTLIGGDDDPGGGQNSMSSPSGAGDGTMNPLQSMAILKMEDMVGPLADNIIAMQKLLDTPALMTGTGNPDDDKHLQEIRASLLKAIADQSATLDIINGFVQTQQMGDLQHSGQEYISATTAGPPNQAGGGSAGAGSGMATPNPLLQNPNQAGLPPNPYDIDLSAVPGLSLGYNPVTRLVEGLNWTIDQTAANENEASKSIMSSAALCGADVPAASPAPSQP